MAQPTYIVPTPSVAVSDALGITQSDVLIRHAVLAAIADMRANPWLLDYCFAWLRQDPLTQNTNSDRDVQQAKMWFKNNNIPVVAKVHLAPAKVPCISIDLQTSTEEDNTVGDTHYTAREPITDPWPALTPEFTPSSWTVSTGVMVVPESIATDLDINPGYMVVTKSGNAYSITDMLNPVTLVLNTGVNDDFGNCTIRAPQPSLVRHLESSNFDESYSLGCHAGPEPIYCQYLHSILVFALLRYRKTLLEARGFERTHISSGAMGREEVFSNENIYTRNVTIAGYVRQVVPTAFEPVIASTGFRILVGGVNQPDFHAVIDPTAAPYPTVEIDSILGGLDVIPPPHVSPLQGFTPQPPNLVESAPETDVESDNGLE